MNKKEPTTDKGKVREAKENLGRAVVEAKKKILQGALTVPTPSLRKPTINCSN